MSHEITGPDKRLAANVTHVRPVTTMCPLMYCQISLSSKRLVAHIAGMLLQPRVNTLVRSEQTGRNESLTTHAACISFVSARVREPVGTARHPIPHQIFLQRILSCSIIHQLHTQRQATICISQHRRSHAIHVARQRITQHFVLSTITNTFTFTLHASNQRAGQSIVLLSTVQTDRGQLICSSSVQDKGIRYAV